MATRSNAGGGHGSRQVNPQGQRLGDVRKKVHIPRAAELGEHVGDHATERGRTGYRGEKPLLRGPGYPSVPLGNQVAEETKCGPGGSRNVMARGSQGVHGSANSGHPMPKGELFPGWPAKS